MAGLFPAVRHRDFLHLWCSSLLTMGAQQVQMVAVAWQIYLLTDSTVHLGLIGLTRLVPLVLFTLTGGVIADTTDRRRMLLWTQTGQVVFMALLGVTTALEVASPWVIYVLNALAASASSLSNPARQALVPVLVPRHHLAQAVSFNELTRHLATVVGPSAAGVSLAWLGIERTYALGTVCLVIGLLTLVSVRVPHAGMVRRWPGLGTMLAGFAFVRSETVVLSMLALDFLMSLFASARALFPVFARDIYGVGAEGLGLLYTASALGAVAAALLLALLNRVPRPGVVVLLSVVAYGAGVALFGAVPNLVVGLVALALTGAGDAAAGALRGAIVQLATPDHLRGRVTALNLVVLQGGPSLGQLEAGLMAALVGAQLTLVGGGLACIACVAGVNALVPRIRRIEPRGTTV